MRSREAEFERKLAQTGLWQLPDLLQTLPDETARLACLCYAASPAGDWLDTPPEVFFSCAAHARYLRENASWTRALPELLILDIMLPEEDGLSILRRLRASPRTEHLPVMMLTARSSEYDKVIGLDGGADDYLTKPFGMMELISRVRALLRRAEFGRERRETLRCGDIECDTTTHTMRACGEELTLTLKEYELLHLMLEHPMQVFTRDRLLSSIWGYEFDGESRTVDVHIRTLRLKLGAAGGQIETVRGVGYRLRETAV